MADTRQVAHESAYIDAVLAAANTRYVAHESAYIDAQIAAADTRYIAHLSAYICEVTPPPSALITYGVAFTDEDGNATTVAGTPVSGDRAAWDVYDYSELHAKDLSDNVPHVHLPTSGRELNSLAYWDGDKWVANSTIPMMRQADTWHAYGGFQNQSETITIAAVDTWTHVTNATNDLWTGLEATGLTLSGDVMTIQNEGDYVGALTMTISGLATKDFQIRIYNVTTSAQMGYVVGTTTTGAGNYEDVTLPLYLECSAGDQLRVEIQCTTDGSDPTVRSAVFEIHYLHD